MKIHFILLMALVATATSFCQPTKNGKHLFILSGQSNMARLNLKESFTPRITKHFGNDNVIIVKDAKGAQPISRWYQDGTAIDEGDEMTQPDLYDSLMVKVHAAIENEEIVSITFIWMQGERDARQKNADFYKGHLLGLYNKINNELPAHTANFIIGRLSDFGMSHKKYPEWIKIRDFQVSVGESNPRFDWINTDDLNDGITRKEKMVDNDLHMSAKGYVIMGERFAEKAIELIQRND